MSFASGGIEQGTGYSYTPLTDTPMGYTYSACPLCTEALP